MNSGYATTIDKIRGGPDRKKSPEKSVLYVTDYGLDYWQDTGNIAVVVRALRYGKPVTVMK